MDRAIHTVKVFDTIYDMIVHFQVSSNDPILSLIT